MIFRFQFERQKYRIVIFPAEMNRDFYRTLNSEIKTKKESFKKKLSLRIRENQRRI